MSQNYNLEKMFDNMNNNVPLVSIICCTYNHEPYIRQCLDGFLMQKTSFEFEVLIHDDASQDKTQEIIREYELKFPDIIKPIYQTENQYSKGVKINLTYQYPRVQGKYIALCEGDDYWTDPLKLQKQVEILEHNPNCQIVFAKIQPVSIEGIKQSWTIPNEGSIMEGIVDLADFTKEEYYNCRWTFHTSSFVFRSNMLTSYKQSCFSEVFPYGDMPLLIYNLLLGNGFFIDEVVGCYRLFSGGYNSYVSKNLQIAIKQDLQLIKALHYFDEYTNYLYHSNVKKKINMLKYNIDRRRYGKLVFLNPRYFKITIRMIANKLHVLNK